MIENFVYVDSHIITEVKKELAANHKIKAIKLIRDNSKCGLKNAKLACDRLLDPTQTGYPKLVTKMFIKSIELQTTEGTVEVDLAGMQLQALSNIRSLGIAEVQRILDLCDILDQWQSPPSHEDVVDGSDS